MPPSLTRADRFLRSRALRLTTGLVAVVAFAACGDADGTITAGNGVSVPVSEVIVQPKVDTIFARDSLQTGDLVQLTAIVIGFSGTKVSGAKVRWSTPDTGIVTVDSLGVVRPKRLGTATVVAKSGSKEDQATVVVAPAAARIAITSATRTAAGLPVTTDTIFVTDSIRPTDRRQLRAVAIGGRGDTLTGFRYAWASSNTNVATVDTAGLVQARGIGTTTITARAGGDLVATRTVVVSSNLKQVNVTARTTRVLVGDTLRLTAVGIGFDGKPVPGVRFTYATSNGAIAQVDTNGVVRFLSPGSVILSAIGNFVTGAFAPSVQVFTYTYQAITSGVDHSCAITQLGFLDCWGRTAEGQTAATADTVCSNVPTPASIGCVLMPKRSNATQTYVSVAAGDFATCGLDDQGRAYCWGVGNFKQGNGQIGGSPTPRLVTSGLTFARQASSALSQSNYTTYSGTISVGGSHACAITDVSLLAYCWGSDASAQLGSADLIVASSTPIPVDTLNGLRFGYISAGYLHTCAITATSPSGVPAGRAYCWGSNATGELGSAGSSGLQTVPTAVSGTLTFANISAGIGGSTTAAGAHTCGVTTGGAVYCWGANAFGQAGTPQSTNPVTTPTQVSPSGFRTVSAGGEFTCGLRVDGQIDCWGRNDVGQLGGGPNAPSATASPVRVASPIMVGPNNTSVAVSGISYSAVSVGRRHACALGTDGWVYCWGSDVLGALGDQFQALTQNRPIRVYHAAP